MSERPRDMGQPLPIRVPGQNADTPIEDVLAERRWAELDGWSQTAETITMPAVTPDPYPVAPRRRLVVAASEVITETPSSALHEHSDLSRTPSARASSTPSASGSARSSASGSARSSASGSFPSSAADDGRSARLSPRRVAVLAGAGLAVLLLGGVAFGLGGGDDAPVVATVPAAAGAVTTVPDEHPVPTVDPVASVSVPANGSASPTPSRSAGPSASASTSAMPMITIGHGSRPIIVTPGAGPTGETPEPEPSLSAVYSYDDTRYAGSVHVVNSGKGAARDWTVTLTVAGGETVSVSSGAVAVSQSGSSVTFRPTGGTVAAGGSVSFGFSLAGEPESAPVGCAVDGVACS
ncbi:cellulose binding domain-containing protein [Actinoplanes sp. NPDC020271]|uniref:cellulose binding domain-containing protein n=1 Tax=Actinoplanes sp. NPDC020271 TaxID=3363896 RepID=UPI0037BCDC46